MGSKGESSVSKTSDVRESQQHTLVLVSSEKKEQTEKWLGDTRNITIQVEYERRSMKAFQQGDYETALIFAQKSLEYSPNPNNLNAWGSRNRLADVYEATEKKEEFLREIDWLIWHCRNEETKRKLIERKQKFIETHS